MKHQPAYFAIIPANVRYADIPDRAKLLFGEITALAQKQGHCFASNSYFAEAYKCSPQAISKHIAALESAGFLKIEHNQSSGNLRKMWPLMNAVPTQPEVDTYQPQVETPINQELRPYQPQVEQIKTSIKRQGIKRSIVAFDESDLTNLIEEIVSYLNAKTGANYWTTTKTTVRAIRDRLKEGYAVDDFKRVVDFKVAKWLGDEKMSEYLRPSTLFIQAHFNDYLNGSKITGTAANTDAALKDIPNLDETLALQYGRFIAHLQEHYPQLWRSACRVFSQSEYFDYLQNKSIPGITMNLSVDEKRTHLSRVMKELSASENKRKQYGTVWQAYEVTMRALLNGKKVEI